jgi:hypothetical protein
MSHLEEIILQETKGLPTFVLSEILDFIKFIKEKKINSIKTDDSLNKELSSLDKSELYHLEEEFKDYKKEYPYE